MDFGLFGPEVDQADMMDLIVPVGARADAEGRMVAETVTLDDALADAAKLGDVAFLLRNCKA